MGFAVNLSADTLAEADTMAGLNIGPVVTVLPADHSRKTCKTPTGRKVVTCPATYQDAVNCKNCALCAKIDRDYIIGFPAHGAGKRKADTVARGKSC
jgi:hypothetical protein